MPSRRESSLSGGVRCRTLPGVAPESGVQKALLLFEARIEAHRDLKLAIAFRVPPRFDEDAAEVRVGFGVRWIDRDGPAVGGGGLVVALELVRGAAQVVYGAQVVRIDLDGLREPGQRLLVVVLVQVEQADVVVGPRELGI